MNVIRSSFSIGDLENLSGIKAHTIRVWERRYSLFEPNRTEGNQRAYSLDDMRRLLNVTVLYQQNVKISHIANLSDEELASRVHALNVEPNTFTVAIKTMQVAMLAFDTEQFYIEFERLRTSHSFTTIYTEVFIPLLSQLGLLWQTKSILPSHEHFISQLIKQKLLKAIDETAMNAKASYKTRFVLFLPDMELHELPLLFVHLQLLTQGHGAIYLGQSVPLKDIETIGAQFDDITFVTYCSVSHSADRIKSYLDAMASETLVPKRHRLWLCGQLASELSEHLNPAIVTPLTSIEEIISDIAEL